MNILNIEHISKIYGEKVIFNDVSFGVQEGDKIGIIGINGTGKTTLLKIIAGMEEPGGGQVVMQNGLKIAYLPQNSEFPEGASVLSYVAGGDSRKEWEKESEAKLILNRLGLSKYSTPLQQLSGGQKKRAALARALLSPAHVFLLDEPTNHLDDEMVTWLEDYLVRFRGVIVMVTHDRYFLDRVTNKIVEISHGKLYSYKANYSAFLALKAEREEMELATERKRQSVLRMELEWAKRGCRARSTKQKARLLRLDALKSSSGPMEQQAVEMDSVTVRMGKKTIELQHVSKYYGGKKIIENFSYIILKNQRLGVVGPNGCGKSTLMKMIAGIIAPDSGNIEIGETIKIGYFSQEEENMDPEQRVIDSVKEIAEYIAVSDGRISASQLLERFLFDAAMQYTLIGKLSGGERRRLHLLHVLAGSNNVLVLDEPGNNLDIPTLTILEDYLSSFPGIVIAVSHDRYFLDNVVDRIFEFSGDGRLTQYEGGYTDYVEARQKKEQEADTSIGKDRSKKKESQKEWKQSRPVKLKFTFKEQKEFETIDEDITHLETEVKALDAEIMENATNSHKLTELTEKKARTEARLEEKIKRWVYLNHLAEKMFLDKKDLN